MSGEPPVLPMPMPIETQRLFLRFVEPGDAEELNAAVDESRAELTPWVPWLHTHDSLETTRAYIAEAIRKIERREVIHLNLMEKATGAIVGGTGYHHFDLTVPKVEIGYWVRTSRAGRGYVTEAVRAQVTYAIEVLGMKRVEIRCSDANERSWRVAERAGFTLEGILRHDCRENDGSLRDTRVYAVVTGPQSAVVGHC